MNSLREIEISARFPKVITFIYEKDPYWINTIQRIIEIYTVMWGGDNWLIIPFDIKDGKLHIEDFFKELIKNYDPDIVWIYEPSGFDLEMANKKHFREICKQIEKKYSKSGMHVSKYQIISEVRKILFKYTEAPNILNLFQIQELYFPLFWNLSKLIERIAKSRKLIEPINFAFLRYPYDSLLTEKELFERLLESKQVSNYVFYLKDKFLNLTLYAITGKLPMYDVSKINKIKDRPLSPLRKVLRKSTKYVTNDNSHVKFKPKVDLDEFIADFLSYTNDYLIKKEKVLIADNFYE